MKKVLILMALQVILVSCQNRKESKESSVFKNVNLIPMTDEIILENMSVLVTDGKILAIGPADELKYPGTALIIDAEGKYLLPGFSDMHVHYQYGKYFKSTYQQMNNLFLAKGITLVRNMWGCPDLLGMRKEIAKKKILGPEIYTTGPIIDSTPADHDGSTVLDDPEDVSGAIRKMKKAGYDAIKVYNQIKPAVYSEIIRASKEYDIPVMGHVPYKVGAPRVIQSEQASLEHFNNLDLEKSEADLIIESGIWNCPTLVMYEKSNKISRLKRMNIPELRYVPDLLIEYWKRADEYSWGSVKKYQEFLKVIHDRGANIVSGTDATMPYVIPGFSLREEFLLMREAGLTPYQILLTTTVNPAKMLGYSDRLGTVEAGKDADLVLLEKNPLLDIRNTGTIAGVMVKGRWLAAGDLQQLLDDVESSWK